MMRKSLASGLVALSTLAAVGTADAACSDRPGTPNNVKAHVVGPNQITFTWTNTATERVWWDINVTDGKGHATAYSQTGVGRGDQGRGLPASHMLIGLKPGETVCVRIKARTGPRREGCVSQLWSGQVCATTTGGPGTTDAPSKGTWGALAADGKGHWGFAVNQPTQWMAQYQARKGCGDQACKVRISAQVRCYAYFESKSGGYWYGLAMHSSGATALQVARSGCEKGAPAGTCRLVKANCGS